MIKIIAKLKEYSSILIAILIIIAFVVPYILLYFYLKKQNKTLTIYPKFEIKSISNQNQIDQNALESGIRVCQEILKKAKK